MVSQVVLRAIDVDTGTMSTYFLWVDDEIPVRVCYEDGREVRRNSEQFTETTEAYYCDLARRPAEAQ